MYFDYIIQVREKLVEKQTALERSEKAKKLRELRKYGKKVSSPSGYYPSDIEIANAKVL